MTLPSNHRVLVVSPVKDEERFVAMTLLSMIQQTRLPALWIVVDDGSTDATGQIVREYASRHSFIRFLQHRSGGRRQPGSPVIRAFNYGLASVDWKQFDFIVKLDCDLSFPPDYFERLLQRFATDESLGIGSGIYLECGNDGAWRPVDMPSYHAFGACKVLRRECFDDIGGFTAEPGWDTVDEVRAITRGWKTGHFADLRVKHHKREGTGIGLLRTSRMHGEIFYRTGGDPLFFVLKILKRLPAAPPVLNAGALTIGYLAALFARRPKLVSAAEARCYRNLLRQRLLGRSGTALLTVNHPH